MEKLPLFIKWYEELQRGISIQGHTDYTQGQLTMLTGVIKQLIPDNEYKLLTKYKPVTKKQKKLLANTQLL